MSKKQERFCSELLSEDEITNFLIFFDMIRPKRIEHLQKEEPFSSDPYFIYPGPKLSSLNFANLTFQLVEIGKKRVKPT